MLFDGKRVLVTGGTGSLGRMVCSQLLSGQWGAPAKVIVFSRDEAKQHYMRVDYLQRTAAEELLYSNFQRVVEFRIGDVRNYASVAAVVADSDIVFNAAALKQVPTCEYFPSEAVETNIRGAENIVRAIRELKLPVETVVGISTDKACKPVNVMGMCKAIQERIFLCANVLCPSTRFICVRYGNVLASRGSVIPLFHTQIANGGPVTVTHRQMTRFLLSIDAAAKTIFAALAEANPGEIYIPRIPSALVTDIAKVLIGDRPIEMTDVGIRPGEKIHEILISEEEIHRVVERGPYFAIRPALPELQGAGADGPSPLAGEYSSSDAVLDLDGVHALLNQHELLIGQDGLAHHGVAA